MVPKMFLRTAVFAVATLVAAACSASPLALYELPKGGKTEISYRGLSVVSGHVKEFTTGVPITGAVVVAVDATTNEIYKLSSRTGSDGRYSLKLPRGQYILQVGSGLHTTAKVSATGAVVQADLLLGDSSAPSWSLGRPEVLLHKHNSAIVRLSGSVSDNHMLRDAVLELNGSPQFSQHNIYSTGYDFDFDIELPYGTHEIRGSAVDASGNLGSPRMNFDLYEVPEPSSILLLGLSLLGGVALLRKRVRRKPIPLFRAGLLRHLSIYFCAPPELTPRSVDSATNASPPAALLAEQAGPADIAAPMHDCDSASRTSRLDSRKEGMFCRRLRLLASFSVFLWRLSADV